MHYIKYVLSGALVALLLGLSLLVADQLRSPVAVRAAFQGQAVGALSPLLARSQWLGVDRSARTLQLSVGLKLRNLPALQRLLRDLYDPASPRYHHFLSVADFTREFAPTPEVQQQVLAYLRGQGFTITRTFPNRLLIDFSGPQALAERVFQVQINDYRAPDGRRFFANSSPPALPAYLAASIDAVTGLDNAARFFHPPISARSRPHLRATANGTCPGPGQSGGAAQVAYIPAQFATAYNYSGLYQQGLTGSGQVVGLFELDGYAPGDIQVYAQCFGGGSVALQNVLLDGFNGQPGQGAIEVELDIEALIGMAPHLAKILVYEAPNTLQGYNDEFMRIVTDRTPVVSVSWGDCESNVTAQEQDQENKIFAEAAAQGQSILVASGDSGSETCLMQNYNFSLVADDPAVQPYVTAVGGTTLTLTSSNAYAGEHVWNDGFLGGASGGGISQHFAMPAWQKGPGVQNQYSNGHRETPDVSLDADPATGYPIYCTAGSSCSGSGSGAGSGWITIGGTSAAAPMWAAMVALANQQATRSGRSVVGFLNPALYRLAAATSSYRRDFHDITPPSNSSTPANNDLLGFFGLYPVTVGYDMATGWGSFNAAALAQDLANPS